MKINKRIDMRTNTFRNFVLTVSLLAAILINLGINWENMGGNISLKTVMNVALADTEGVYPCAHATTFFQNNMIQCQWTTPCYNSSGTECGREMCCEYHSGTGSCNEFECD